VGRISRRDGGHWLKLEVSFIRTTAPGFILNLDTQDTKGLYLSIWQGGFADIAK
jgi:hypothetical protein